MSKMKSSDISKKERQRILSEFFEVLSKFRTKDEIIEFLVGSMTPSEVLMFARRVQVAGMLLEGKTHREIREYLGVGYQNILSVDRWLHTGNEESDARKAEILRRVHSRKQRTGYRREPSGSMLHKYAGYRLLGHLISEILR